MEQPGHDAPDQRCTSCAAVGTYYLTCASLRLPPGYRINSDPDRGRSPRKNRLRGPSVRARRLPPLLTCRRSASWSLTSRSGCTLRARPRREVLNEGLAYTASWAYAVRVLPAPRRLAVRRSPRR